MPYDRAVSVEEQDLATIAGWIRDAIRVVVLTGAGISTESGIPDFRGPQGVWTRDPEAEKRATLQYYVAHREARVASWRGRSDGGLLSGATPNAGHLALADLDRQGRIELLVTQNIDGLHLDAGTDPARLVQIHGTVRDFACLGCGERGPIERVLARVRAGDEDPHCRSCGGILKSATISFGQNLVPEDLARSEAAAAGCDLFIAIGTTLTVYPVAALPQYALRNGARLVIINADETPYDPYADAIVRGRIGQVLPAIVRLV
jgi:NAD-dependent deacetylase